MPACASTTTCTTTVQLQFRGHLGDQHGWSKLSEDFELFECHEDEISGQVRTRNGVHSGQGCSLVRRIVIITL